MTNPDGRTVSYQYDSDDHLVAVIDWSKNTSSYSYDAAGDLIKLVQTNGIVTTYSYDAARRLTSLTNSGPQGVISAFLYTLDKNGNRTSVTTSGTEVLDSGTTQYQYDSMQRLVSVHYPDGVVTFYVYDGAGNRTSMVTLSNGQTTSTTYHYNAADELISSQKGAAITTYTYDKDGNMLSQQSGQSKISYQYNAMGELVSVSDGYTTTHYTYNGDGFRVGQRVTSSKGTATTSYLLSPTQMPQILEEYSSTGMSDNLYGLSLTRELAFTVFFC